MSFVLFYLSYNECDNALLDQGRIQNFGLGGHDRGDLGGMENPLAKEPGALPWKILKYGM